MSKLAGTIFEGRTFDVDKFVNMPKCQGHWYSTAPDHSISVGCLLTTMWVALGFNPNLADLSRSNHLISHLKKETDLLAIRCGIMNDKFPWSTFCDTVIALYDGYKMQEGGSEVFSPILRDVPAEPAAAIDMVWEFLSKSGLYTAPQPEQKQQLCATVEYAQRS